MHYYKDEYTENVIIDHVWSQRITSFLFPAIKIYAYKAQQNPELLVLIVSIVIMLARKNIPACGYHNNRSNFINSSATFNEGNFKVVLRFRVEVGVSADTVLHKHLETP